MGIEYRPYGDSEGIERKGPWRKGESDSYRTSFGDEAHSSKSQLTTTANMKGKQQTLMQTRGSIRRGSLETEQSLIITHHHQPRWRFASENPGCSGDVLACHFQRSHENCRTLAECIDVSTHPIRCPKCEFDGRRDP